LGYFRGASTYLVRRCKGDLGKDWIPPSLSHICF
jgi:hypothetical protein